MACRGKNRCAFTSGEICVYVWVTQKEARRQYRTEPGRKGKERKGKEKQKPETRAQLSMRDRRQAKKVSRMKAKKNANQGAAMQMKARAEAKAQGSWSEVRARTVQECNQSRDPNKRPVWYAERKRRREQRMSKHQSRNIRCVIGKRERGRGERRVRICHGKAIESVVHHPSLVVTDSVDWTREARCCVNIT